MNSKDQILDQKITEMKVHSEIRDNRIIYFAFGLFLFGFICREIHWPFAGEFIVFGNALMVSFFLARLIREGLRKLPILFFLASITSLILIFYWFNNEGSIFVGIVIFIFSLVGELIHIWGSTPHPED